MKKYLLALLAAIMIVSLLAASAYAADSSSITITAEPEVTEAHAGDTVSFVLTAASPTATPIVTVEATLSATDGLTISNVEMLCGGYFNSVSYADESKFISCSATGAGGASGTWSLARVTCTVDDNASLGDKTLSVSVGEFAPDGGNDLIAPSTTFSSPAIKVTHGENDHVWEGGQVDETPANCTASGLKVTHCATPGCDGFKKETIDPLGHQELTFGDVSWNVNDTKTSATATTTVTCKRANCPDYAGSGKQVSVTDSDPKIVDATCTTSGTITFNATFTVEDTVHGDWSQEASHSVTVDEGGLGHVWGEPTYTWDGDTVTATRHCTREGDEATTITATAKGVKKETPATCTKDGSSYYEATVKFTEDGKSYTVESTPVTIPATGHKWADATFTWNDENTNVTKVIATCSNGNCPDEGSVDLTASTTVTNETTKKATCTDDGTVTYTATAKATNPAKDFTDTKNVTVSKLGHDWTGDAVITWKDDSDPAKGATVTLKCKKDPTHTLTKDATVASAVKQPASCTKDEITTYTVTADFKTESNKDQPENTKPSTNVFSATKDAKTKDKLGHKWPEPKDVKFTWTDTDPTAPTAALSVSCQNKGCDTHYDTPQELTVSVAKTDSTDPKCAEDGSATWSATAKTPDGKVTYSEDGHKTVLSKLGHDWGEPVFNWTEKDGKWDATEASRTCKRDAEHTDKANATVKAETTDATYTAAGKTVYTATAEFDGKVITDTKETTIPKLTASVKTNVPAANAGSGAEAALQSSTDALVDAVLSGTKPAGMPDNVYEALQDAAESDQSGLTVSTELVVSPTDTPSTIPGAVSAIDASIKITINNTDIEEYVPVSGNLTEVSEPITLKVPKPTSGGPIFWVVGIHNGNQSKLACTFSGNDILFSTAQFSTFVVVGSNDISNANVTGVDPSYAYTGAVIRPAVKVTINGDNETLTEGTDYTVEYKDNTNVGTATVTITGIGKYTGTVTKTFAITEKPVTATATPTPTATAAPSATSAAGAPATGDETPVALYAGMLVLSAAGLALVLRKRRPTDT